MREIWARMIQASSFAGYAIIIGGVSDIVNGNLEVGWGKVLTGACAVIRDECPAAPRN